MMRRLRSGLSKNGNNALEPPATSPMGGTGSSARRQPSGNGDAPELNAANSSVRRQDPPVVGARSEPQKSNAPEPVIQLSERQQQLMARRLEREQQQQQHGGSQNNAQKPFVSRSNMVAIDTAPSVLSLPRVALTPTRTPNPVSRNSMNSSTVAASQSHYTSHTATTLTQDEQRALLRKILQNSVASAGGTKPTTTRGNSTTTARLVIPRDPSAIGASRSDLASKEMLRKFLAKSSAQRQPSPVPIRGVDPEPAIAPPPATHVSQRTKSDALQNHPSISSAESSDTLSSVETESNHGGVAATTAAGAAAKSPTKLSSSWVSKARQKGRWLAGAGSVSAGETLSGALSNRVIGTVDETTPAKQSASSNLHIRNRYASATRDKSFLVGPNQVPMTTFDEISAIQQDGNMRGTVDKQEFKYNDVEDDEDDDGYRLFLTTLQAEVSGQHGQLWACFKALLTNAPVPNPLDEKHLPNLASSSVGGGSGFEFDDDTKQQLLNMAAHLKKAAAVECVGSSQLVNDKKYFKELRKVKQDPPNKPGTKLAYAARSTASSSSDPILEARSQSSKAESHILGNEVPSSEITTITGRVNHETDPPDRAAVGHRKGMDPSPAERSITGSRQDELDHQQARRRAWIKPLLRIQQHRNMKALTDQSSTASSIADSQNSTTSSHTPLHGSQAAHFGVNDSLVPELEVTLREFEDQAQKTEEQQSTYESHPDPGSPWSEVHLRSVSTDSSSPSSNGGVSSKNSSSALEPDNAPAFTKVRLRKVTTVSTKDSDESWNNDESTCRKDPSPTTTDSSSIQHTLRDDPPSSSVSTTSSLPLHASVASSMLTALSDGGLISDPGDDESDALLTLFHKQISPTSNSTNTVSSSGQETSNRLGNKIDEAVIIQLKQQQSFSKLHGEQVHRVIVGKKMIMMVRSGAREQQASVLWKVPRTQVQSLALDMAILQVTLALLEPAGTKKLLSFGSSEDCLKFANAFYQMVTFSSTQSQEDQSGYAHMAAPQPAAVERSRQVGPLNDEEENVLKTYRRLRQKKAAPDALHETMSSEPSAQQAKESSSSAQGDVAKKYLDMLKVGIPLEAVKHKMIRDQVASNVFAAVMDNADEAPPKFISAAQLPSSPVSTFSSTISFSTKDSDAAEQYRKMLRLRIPQEAVRHKMQKDEVDPKLFELVFGAEPEQSETIILSDEEEAITKKYRQMLKMMIPIGAVKHSMMKDGVSEKIVTAVVGDADGGQKPPCDDETVVATQSRKKLVLTEDEESVASQFRKMLKLQIPKDAVLTRMKQEGVSDKIITTVLGSQMIQTKPSEDSRDQASHGSNLVSLHWTPLVGKELDNSIWKASSSRTDSVPEPEGSDISQLITLFQKKVTTAISKDKRDGDESVSSKKEKLLDITRSNNVAISLKAFKEFSFAELANIIAFLDPLRKVRGERVLFLRDLIPTPSEAKIIKSFDGSIERLVPAEVWFRQIVSIDRIETKVQVLRTMEMFQSEAAALQRSFKLLSEVCQQVMDSVKLQDVLRMVLKIGNIMNEGTRTGGAAGFKFDSLLRLTQTKSADGKTTVLDFLVTFFVDKGQRATLMLSDEFPECHTASRVLVNDLLSEVKTLENAIVQCEKELSDFSNEDTNQGMPTGKQMVAGRSDASSVISGVHKDLIASVLRNRQGSSTHSSPDRRTIHQKGHIFENISSAKATGNANSNAPTDDETETMLAFSGSINNNRLGGLKRLSLFLTLGCNILKHLQAQRDEALEACRDLSQYCGESGGYSSTTSLLGILAEFVSSLEAGVKKYDEIKLAESKKLKVNEARPTIFADVTAITDDIPHNNGKSLVLLVSDMLKDANKQTKDDFKKGRVYNNPSSRLKAIYDKEKDSSTLGSPNNTRRRLDIVTAIKNTDTRIDKEDVQQVRSRFAPAIISQDQKISAVYVNSGQPRMQQSQRPGTQKNPILLEADRDCITEKRNSVGMVVTNVGSSERLPMRRGLTNPKARDGSIEKPIPLDSVDLLSSASTGRSAQYQASIIAVEKERRSSAGSENLPIVVENLLDRKSEKRVRFNASALSTLKSSDQEGESSSQPRNPPTPEVRQVGEESSVLQSVTDVELLFSCGPTQMVTETSKPAPKPEDVVKPKSRNALTENAESSETDRNVQHVTHEFGLTRRMTPPSPENRQHRWAAGQNDSVKSTISAWNELNRDKPFPVSSALRYKVRTGASSEAVNSEVVSGRSDDPRNDPTTLNVDINHTLDPSCGQHDDCRSSQKDNLKVVSRLAFAERGLIRSGSNVETALVVSTIDAIKCRDETEVDCLSSLYVKQSENNVLQANPSKCYGSTDASHDLATQSPAPDVVTKPILHQQAPSICAAAADNTLVSCVHVVQATTDGSTTDYVPLTDPWGKFQRHQIHAIEHEPSPLPQDTVNEQSEPFDVKQPNGIELVTKHVTTLPSAQQDCHMDMLAETGELQDALLPATPREPPPFTSDIVKGSQVGITVLNPNLSVSSTVVQIHEPATPVSADAKLTTSAMSPSFSASQATEPGVHTPVHFFPAQVSVVSPQDEMGSRVLVPSTTAASMELQADTKDTRLDHSESTYRSVQSFYGNEMRPGLSDTSESVDGVSERTGATAPFSAKVSNSDGMVLPCQDLLAKLKPERESNESVHTSTLAISPDIALKDAQSVMASLCEQTEPSLAPIEDEKSANSESEGIMEGPLPRRITTVELVNADQLTFHLSSQASDPEADVRVSSVENEHPVVGHLDVLVDDTLDAAQQEAASDPATDFLNISSENSVDKSRCEHHDGSNTDAGVGNIDTSIDDRIERAFNAVEHHDVSRRREQHSDFEGKMPGDGGARLELPGMEGKDFKFDISGSRERLLRRQSAMDELSNGITHNHSIGEKRISLPSSSTVNGSRNIEKKSLIDLAREKRLAKMGPGGLKNSAIVPSKQDMLPVVETARMGHLRGSSDELFSRVSVPGAGNTPENHRESPVMRKARLRRHDKGSRLSSDAAGTEAISGRTGNAVSSGLIRIIDGTPPAATVEIRDHQEVALSTESAVVRMARQRRELRKSSLQS